LNASPGTHLERGSTLGQQEKIVSEDQLALAAALAGVATVDLGGAGAGQYLRRGLAAAVDRCLGIAEAVTPDLRADDAALGKESDSA